jgi:hypothetical protein
MQTASSTPACLRAARTSSTRAAAMACRPWHIRRTDFSRSAAGTRQPHQRFFRANSMANSFGLFFLRAHDNFRLLRQKYRTQKAKDQIRNVNDDRSQNLQNKCVPRFF